jgi:mannose-1-phosphate guanylyltransferase
VRHLAGDVPVVVLPSDHFVDDDRIFAGHVRTTLEVVRARPQLVALIGIVPSSAETDYGWIEPAGRALRHLPDVFRVRRFVEKPPAATARRLIARGCLWNSFVMVGRVDAFLDVVARTAGELSRAFEPVARMLGTPRERAALDRLYARLRPTSFAATVLMQAARHLVVVRADGFQWSDWGTPRRVRDSLEAASGRVDLVPDLVLA